MSASQEVDIFSQFREGLLNLDPVSFCQKYLTVDGKPFRLIGNGYKPFVDIYRYIGIKALDKNSKPVILLKSRQVGGSLMAAVLEMFFMGSGLFGKNEKSAMRIIHAFPTLGMAASYSKTKLNPMIKESIPLPGQAKAKTQKSYMESLLDPANGDAINFKQFLNGNHVWIESTGLDADRLRGKTVDAIFFDEVQDIPGAAIGNALKMLNKAQYGAPGDGIQVYFGTPKQKASEYHRMWQMSSQQYYYLHCEKCNEHFPFFTPGSNDWEKIWVRDFTIQCPLCQHEQDKIASTERGKWVSLNKDENSKFIGFHINQLLMPEFSKEKILDSKPENHPINTERMYQNEILGEFFSGESGIISIETIRETCGDPARRFKNTILPTDQNKTFLGLDIGKKSDLEQLLDSKKSGAQGQSYSTAVVLQEIGPNLLNIIFATKFKKNDLQSKKSIIAQIMKQYNISLGVCDIGYANDLNEIMQTEFGSRFLSSQAMGKIIGHIKYQDNVFPKLINFERDHYIADMYDQIKKGQIRFPLGSYEQIDWLMQHCVNMDIKATKSNQTGEVAMHYVKAGNNDGFMALINAYLAYRFKITDGFKINNPLLHEHNRDRKPLVTGGYFVRKR